MSFWLPCLLLASLLAAATAGPVLDRRPDASRALGDGTIKVEDHRRVMRRVNEDDKIKMEPYRVNERDNDHQIRQIGPNMIECGGRTEVDKLNEMFNLGVPTGDYETIAGYVLELEKRLPEIGLKLRTNRLV